MPKMPLANARRRNQEPVHIAVVGSTPQPLIAPVTGAVQLASDLPLRRTPLLGKPSLALLAGVPPLLRMPYLLLHCLGQGQPRQAPPSVPLFLLRGGQPSDHDLSAIVLLSPNIVQGPPLSSPSNRRLLLLIWARASGPPVRMRRTMKRKSSLRNTSPEHLCYTRRPRD